jgi:hypothetical protein
VKTTDEVNAIAEEPSFTPIDDSQQPQVLLPPPPPNETNDLRVKQPGGRRLLPNIKVFWIRGYDPRFIQFKKAVLYMGLGQKESGKSALLETVACRYPKIIDLFGCYDEITEVFTKEGWKLFKDISFQDEIATLNIDSNRVEFHKPTAIQSYDYNGEMIHFGGGKNSRYDLLVTPNHNMVIMVRGCIQEKPEFLKAYQILTYPNNFWSLLPLFLANQFQWNCTHKGTIELSKEKVVEEKYSGKVYDVTVPNHTLFIRRNGKTAWSGNSRDNEGLAWCRSPFKNSVLFITGDNVDVKSQWDTKSVSEVKLSDFEKYRVVLSCSAFHSGVEAEFHAMNQIVLTLYRRTHWEHLWFLMVREASNFIYSRLKISPNQTIAKADFLYLLREARHMGYPTGVDTLRWTGMDADARGIADYLFIKQVGVIGLPKELHFLYSYINPPSFMGMKPRIFGLISNRGPLALAHFEYPWWHKEEKEDMLKLLDIKIDAGDVPDYGDQARNTVSDFEHIRLVGLYLEKKSMQKVAKILSRSPATINKHISEHDAEVAKAGCCSQCKRVRGMHQNTLLVKRGAKYSEPITSFEEFEKTF